MLTTVCSNPSATSHSPRPRQTTTGNWPVRPPRWWPDLTQRASKKPGAVQILQADWYLLKLINETLDLALIESGKSSLSLEPLSLDEVLNDCHAVIEPQAQVGGIRVSFPQLPRPWYAFADRTRLKPVSINLLSNAFKYKRAGGRAEVRCSAAYGGHTRISFQGAGEGLSADKLSQLFQPFNRLGQEAGEEEGTGIGLVVSKRLVRLMRGEIRADSTVGVVSVFWIERDNALAPLIPR